MRAGAVTFGALRSFGAVWIADRRTRLAGHVQPGAADLQRSLSTVAVAAVVGGGFGGGRGGSDLGGFQGGYDRSGGGYRDNYWHAPTYHGVWYARRDVRCGYWPDPRCY